MVGLRVQDRVDLRAALDLKRADRLAFSNEFVRLLVRLGDIVHVRAHTGPALDLVVRQPHHRQCAEAQEVELRHADHVQIVLVELEDRAAHRRLLDGEIAPQRRGREHEAADVRRVHPRQPLEPLERHQ